MIESPDKLIRSATVSRRRLSLTIVSVYTLIAWAALAVCITGCQGDRPTLVPVTGKVIYKGEPLTAGSVHLFPDAGNSFDKDQPSSLLQLDGSFTIKTFPYGDGVPPGRYKVTLAPQLAGRIQLPHYADPTRTPLSIDVPDSGVRDHVLEIK